VITRQTDRTGPAQSSRHCDPGWADASDDDPCDTVGLTSPERLAASPVGTVRAPDTLTGPTATSVTTPVTESHISAEATPRTRRQIADSERVVCWQAGRALAARSPTYVFLR